MGSRYIIEQFAGPFRVSELGPSNGEICRGLWLSVLMCQLVSPGVENQSRQLPFKTVSNPPKPFALGKTSDGNSRQLKAPQKSLEAVMTAPIRRTLNSISWFSVALFNSFEKAGVSVCSVGASSVDVDWSDGSGPRI